MKCRVINIEPDDYEDGASFKLLLDDEVKLYVSPGEPEDNTLCRDLSFVYEIPDLLKLAYEAGKRGEDWIFEREDKEYSEEDED